MDHKNLIVFTLLFAGIAGGAVLSSVSYRVRDAFFMLMVILSAVIEYVDVNLASHEWYRGTSRGFELSVVDVLSVSVLVGAFIRPPKGEKRWFWPPSFGWMAIFFLFAALCVAVANPRIFGYFELLKMVRGLVIFLAAAWYLRGERELKLFVLALGVAVCFEGSLALVQRYYSGIHRVYGSVDDSNSLSMYLCTTTPVFVAVIMARFSKYLKALGAAAIALGFIGVILTISRAGLIAMLSMLFCATAATISYRITLRRILIAFVVLLGMTGALAKAWKTIGARFKDDSLKNEYVAKHEQNRGYYIRIALEIAKDSWFGVGPNNWSYWVSNKYGPKLGFYFVHYLGTEQPPSDKVPAGRNIDEAQAAPAHSLAALTAGEMGFGGLLLLTILWLRWLLMGASFLWPRTPDPMRRLGVGILFGIGGTFFQSMTEWVYRQSPIFFTFHIMVGVLAALVYLRKHERKLRKMTNDEGQMEEDAVIVEEPLPEPDEPKVTCAPLFEVD